MLILPTLGLILVTLIWGGGFVASDLALNGFTPFQIMFLRFMIATILMGITSIDKLKKINCHTIKSGIILGVSLFLGFSLQIVGLQYTTPSKNAFLTSLNVVLVPFIAYFFLHKQMKIKNIIGALCSVIGVALLSLNDFSIGFGDLLTIACAVAFAFQIFLTGMYVESCDESNLNFMQMLVASILSLIFIFLFQENKVGFDTTSIISILYLGIFSTTVCYLLQTKCQKYVDESKTAIILSMESVFGTLFSMLILKEHLTLRMILGCVIILSGVLISSVEKGSEVYE